MNTKRNTTSALIAAAMLMAISAVGPGFLTQTTVFTKSLGASFGFVILLSIFIDIGVQLNIWRVLRSEEHTSELQSRENLVCRLLLEKKNTQNAEKLS